MLKASALYIVIIVALVIAIFSASLITTAYFYRLEMQKNLRYDRLLNNLNSGVSLLLSDAYNQYDEEMNVNLSEDNSGSVSLYKEKWGVYDLAMVKSFSQADTLKKAFLIADKVKDNLALYVSDEDRPISISGSTQITGDVALPKAGIKQAYVEGKPYSGKKLVNGAINTSERNLPVLNNGILSFIEKYLDDTTLHQTRVGDSLFNTFFNKTQIVRIHKSKAELTSTSMQGKIILLCDTVLTISGNVQLKDVIVFATSIVIKDGFKGTCQLFARDSIIVGRNAEFSYPSCLGIIKPSDSKIQPKITLGSGSAVSGILFTWERTRSDLQTRISLSKNSLVKGEIYASGFVRMEKPLTVQGKVSCNRFVIQTPTTLYENYLIDITVNRSLLSKYYLSSPLFAAESTDRKVLKWLN